MSPWERPRSKSQSGTTDWEKVLQLDQFRPRRKRRTRRRVFKPVPQWFPLVAVTGGVTVGFLTLDPQIASLSAQNEVPTHPSVGRASVVDGDTLYINGTRIRLHGIDAPESAQFCRARGVQWRCGKQASSALAGKIGQRRVTCEPKDRDRYGRIVAVCRLKGEDLNAWMVAQGWAVAYRRYSSDYVRQQREARMAKRGIWQGDFVPPWYWRQGKRLDGPSARRRATAQPTRCLIKGNVSRRGERIYHVPGGYYYDRTRISRLRGERWFCSESEARAAGWRRSRR